MRQKLFFFCRASFLAPLLLLGMSVACVWYDALFSFHRNWLFLNVGVSRGNLRVYVDWAATRSWGAGSRWNLSIGRDRYPMLDPVYPIVREVNGEDREVFVPLFYLVPFSLVPLVVVKPWRQWPRRGYCVACGYDLRAGHERCPECGALVAEWQRS